MTKTPSSKPRSGERSTAGRTLDRSSRATQPATREGASASRGAQARPSEEDDSALESLGKAVSAPVLGAEEDTPPQKGSSPSRGPSRKRS